MNIGSYYGLLYKCCKNYIVAYLLLCIVGAVTFSWTLFLSVPIILTIIFIVFDIKNNITL